MIDSMGWEGGIVHDWDENFMYHNGSTEDLL